MMLHVK